MPPTESAPIGLSEDALRAEPAHASGDAVAAPLAIPFFDPDLPVAERARDLVARLTLEEKAGQMLHEAPAIPRLGIPEYNWWNEGLHGVARAGVATVFPQAIGLAAMWSEARLRQVAEVIAEEARAKHHEFARQGDRGYYQGLTYWSPNINIFRDPRWGRGHETYGECPFLTARLGVVFCQALQGDDPRYFKLVATPKHFAVHSGPEALRHEFDARATPKDLWETYLPAFEACVTEAGAHSVMAAYNRTNGEACSGSTTLLQDILRERWGFEGFVVSDCWAVKDLHEHHKLTATPEESAAATVKAGCDLNCGCTYSALPAAVEQGLLAEAELDVCLERLFAARLRLGMFDPPERVPYAAIGYEQNDCASHAQLALEVARESMVLLKNDAVLPLDRSLRSIAVIGPNSNDATVLVGNYHGVPSNPVTPLEGIRAALRPHTRVWYAEGCPLTDAPQEGVRLSAIVSEAVSAAERSDVVVLCLGLSADVEGEQGDVGNSQAAGDKSSLSLPGRQQELLERVVAVGKPTVLVLLSGSALDLRWAHDKVGAIVQAWYPGQAAGQALAGLLFGDHNPCGRLPVTFPLSLEHVPEFTDYSMRGRTYRYAEHEPLYPFGFGLSYTRFSYSELRLSQPTLKAAEEIEVTATVKNAGRRAGVEVVQLYVQLQDAPCPVPKFDLRGFQRLELRAGESQQVSFRLPAEALSFVDDAGQRRFEPGRARVFVGGSQPDNRSAVLLGCAPLRSDLELAAS